MIREALKSHIESIQILSADNLNSKQKILESIESQADCVEDYKFLARQYKMLCFAKYKLNDSTADFFKAYAEDTDFKGKSQEWYAKFRDNVGLKK
jgi:predicted Zn-dependent protease